MQDKGVNELVEAFEIVHETNPLTHLVLVGNFERHLDPLKAETERVIENHPNIHAVGYKSNVVDYFAIADVFTFPSYREGFPNAVMQAASMQLNCIVSNINGCNEIIQDGKNGLIIPPKNVEKLRNKMEWCIHNKKESKIMGLESRDIIQINYERQYVWNQILKEYKSVYN